MNKYRSLIFPSGKVHKLYIQYLGWSFVSNITVSVESVLATHSMLYAINMDSEANRTIQYISKDIVGQLGSLGYIAKVSKNSDQQPRNFLKYSNIIQQSALITMCATPFAPNYFLLLAGGSNILTNISFASFGAINARVIQKLAVDNNIGEIYAKIAVINTLGSSIGLLMGLSITVMVPDHSVRLLLLPLLGIVRVYTYNKAVRQLV